MMWRRLPVRRTPSGQERLEHVIISEVGPTQLDRYVSRLEGEIEEFMSETVTRCVEEDGEMMQQTIKETQTFVIRGVVDPRTGEEVLAMLTVYQFIDKYLTDSLTFRNSFTAEGATSVRLIL